MKRVALPLATVVVVAVAIVLLVISPETETSSVPEGRGTSDPAGFGPPDRSTPENTLRTFWWAVKSGKKDAALACVDRARVAKGPHGRSIERFLDECAELDTSDFRFIGRESRASVQAPNHCMDYEMEKDEGGRWVIVSIHP